MSKLKENTLFVIVFFTIMTLFGKAAFHFFTEYEKTWIELMIQSGIVTFLLLLDKIYKFSDKIKRMLTFIK